MTDPIRVLRVIARLNVGGPALHVSYLTRELDRRGYETTLVTGRLSSGEGGMAYVAEELGVEPVYVDGLKRELSVGGDLRALVRIADLIRDFRPDIIHTHTAKAGAVSRLAAMVVDRRDPPILVHTFHGHVLRGQFAPAKERLYRVVEQRLARRTDALVAVGPQVRDDLVALRIAPANRFVVVRLGIDLGRRVSVGPDAGTTTRRELGIAETAPVVGWFGRMTEVKRPDVLLDAFAAVRRSRADAVLLLVGDGPLRPELEGRAAALGISQAIRFLGFRAEVGPLYAACDVVALSSMAEGTPVTLIEALGAGRMVVATDVDGVRDVVGEDGILVPEGDAAALGEGLVSALDDRERRASIAEQAPGRLFERYAVDRLVGDVDRLYRSLLTDAGRL